MGEPEMEKGIEMEETEEERDEGTGYVPENEKPKLKNAVFFGMLAILMLVISTIMNIIWGGYELSQYNNDSGYDVYMKLYLGHNFIIVGLYIAFIVLFLIFLVKMYRSSHVFGKLFKRFVLLTIIFYGAYMIMNFFISPTIMGTLQFLWIIGIMPYGVVEGSGAFFQVVIMFTFMLLLIIPVAPLASKKEGRVISYMAIVYVAGLTPLYEITFQFMEARTALILYLALYLPLVLVVYCMFLFTYNSIWRSLPGRMLKVDWRKLKDKRSVTTIGRYTRRYISFIKPNPYRSLIPVVVIALLYGGVMGVMAKDPFERLDDGSSGIFEFLEDIDIGPADETFLLSEELGEGEEIIHNFGASGNVSGVIAELRWTDENDLFRRENQPDTFKIILVGGGQTDTSM
ncbi:MAG: hypothetical protein U9R75_01700, partial [Candidatus Thermoplasmatota archaeon]|nr:hypothetical protein [Candidatus Thermoplasmatota archaeon]